MITKEALTLHLNRWCRAVISKDGNTWVHVGRLVHVDDTHATYTSGDQTKTYLLLDHEGEITSREYKDQ